jgi:nitrate reductase cytochrome c-type subunit
MKKYLLMLVILFSATIVFAQAGKKTTVKEKPPTQKEMDEMMKEMQKAMDEMDPEDFRKSFGLR